MPKRTRPLAYLEGGIQKHWHDTHDGDWVHETIQDCDPILDANKAEQNTSNPLKWGDLRMTHRIPLILIAKWRNELGIDYWNKDHQGAVDRLLASSDYQWLRVDGMKNHNVSMSDLKIGPESPIFQAPQRKPGAVLASDGTPMAAN